MGEVIKFPGKPKRVKLCDLSNGGAFFYEVPIAASPEQIRRIWADDRLVYEASDELPDGAA